jgi:hypothetical protein
MTIFVFGRAARRAALASLVSLPALRAHAQVTESPVAFDSAGRVPAISQALADRLRLGPPAWPVTGRFDKARLFRSSEGAYVLVVERPSRALDRYALSDAQTRDLRYAIQLPLNAGRRAGIGEQTDIVSEPAGNAFVRNQALLGIMLYGPATAGAVGNNSPSASAATELIVAGGTFFAAMARRQLQPTITTAQNNLATHAAIHGAALGGALAYVAGVDDGNTASGAVLLGGIGGTLAGLQLGKAMTDAEAAASGFGADVMVGTTVGVMGMSGALTSGDGKPQVGIASAALITGYALGPLYPRRARYTVTAGDVRSVTWATMLGVGVASIPFIDDGHHSTEALSGALTAGLLGGMIVGDRLLAKPYDHTRSEATLLFTGMTAGGLIGGGVAAAGKANPQTTVGLLVGGGILGLAATEGFFRSSGHSLSLRTPIQTETGERRVGVSVNPMGLAFAAGRRPGRFSIMRVTF